MYAGEEARSGLFIAQIQGDKREEVPVNEFGRREGEIGDGGAFLWADGEVARGDGVARARMASRGGGVAAGALCVARGGGAGVLGAGNDGKAKPRRRRHSVLEREKQRGGRRRVVLELQKV